MSSNIERIFFALNVRHYGPQPSIFVRSFSAITKLRVSRSTGLASMIEFCVQGSINPEAAWVEPLLEQGIRWER